MELFDLKPGTVFRFVGEKKQYIMTDCDLVVNLSTGDVSYINCDGGYSYSDKVEIIEKRG